MPQHMVYPAKWCDSQENLHMEFQGSGSLQTQYTSSCGTRNQTEPFAPAFGLHSSKDTMNGAHIILQTHQKVTRNHHTFGKNPESNKSPIINWPIKCMVHHTMHQTACSQMTCVAHILRHCGISSWKGDVPVAILVSFIVWHEQHRCTLRCKLY